ncbi:hypothetical protein PPL_03399 [Heterostelium album PN500]|uniref:Uncharacterized protein n=1 Tax=Heterostelium pallidum (strain ATCC 26659 / Pp 5 / PN500) TaxID=670386 RepID=D3B4S3_HETP5|nr:hypothetical protein PPL_03399 [Heterostelium album PN500]EFA84321.1 hypothetical protein PPL_03399 [Heterostelium album PN500]|eukprot:XP_020436436.1 hypothetical protein PPL_03399 [Heterostelium album PN500]
MEIIIEWNVIALQSTAHEFLYCYCCVFNNKFTGGDGANKLNEVGTPIKMRFLLVILLSLAIVNAQSPTVTNYIGTMTNSTAGATANQNVGTANLDITNYNPPFGLNYTIIVVHNQTVPASGTYAFTFHGLGQTDNIDLPCATFTTSAAGLTCVGSLNTTEANAKIVSDVLGSSNLGNGTIYVTYSEQTVEYGRALLTVRGPTNNATTGASGSPTGNTTSSPTSSASATSATGTPSTANSSTTATTGTTGAASQLIPTAFVGLLLILLAVL